MYLTVSRSLFLLSRRMRLWEMICLSLILPTQPQWLLETKESVLAPLVNGNVWKLALFLFFLMVTRMFLILGPRSQLSSLLMLLARTESTVVSLCCIFYHFFFKICKNNFCSIKTWKEKKKINESSVLSFDISQVWQLPIRKQNCE